MTVRRFLAPPQVRVLLVEDTEVDARILETVLRRESFEVRRCGQLAEAMLALRSEEFDVILSDLGLPDSSGLSTLEALRQHAMATPVVVMTGRDDQATALRAVAAGAQDYLVKGSTDANALVRAIRYAVERGRASEEVSVSEARMRTILEGALDAVVSINHEGRIVRWNRSAEEIFGRERSAVLGRPMAELLIPERFRSTHQRAMRAFLDTGDASSIGRRVEWIALRADGSEFPIEVRITAEGDSSGMTFTAFISDITERRRAEEERIASVAKFRALVEHTYDVIYLCDGDGRFTYVSPAITRVLGYPPEELLGRRPLDFVHPDDREHVAGRFGSAEGATPVVAEFRFRHRDGSWRYLEVIRANRLGDPAVNAIVGTARDVSGRRESEQALEQLRRQIEHAARVESLGRVSASVAHEFNNLLMVLAPLAEVLRRKAQTDPSLEKPARHVIETVRRGQRLTDEIFRFTNPVQPRIEPLDLGALIREFADEVRELLLDREVEIDPSATQLETRADADQLAQVLLNLVANARDATKSGGVVTIGAARGDELPFVREELANAEQFVVFYVRDNGCGIPAEAQKQIFEPFFTTGKRRGSGLGLAVAFRITASHGGQILCESEEGAGATFYVALPSRDSGAAGS
ncbi:MAG TPA: PAS domain S-box protein [Thermoanaerobaculia bacterium]|jgi:hypothetical protein